MGTSDHQGGSPPGLSESDSEDMRTERERFPDLFNFLSSYLSQDWVLEYPDADAAVDDAIRFQPAEERLRAKEQLDLLLSELSDEESAERAVRRLHIAYYPPGDGQTHLDWLRHVQDVLGKVGGARQRGRHT